MLALKSPHRLTLGLRHHIEKRDRGLRDGQTPQKLSGEEPSRPAGIDLGHDHLVARDEVVDAAINAFIGDMAVVAGVGPHLHQHCLMDLRHLELG